MKKCIVLLLFIFTLTLSGCTRQASGDTQTGTKDILQKKLPQERLPSVPQELWDHVLLDERDSGICETLTDDVLITVLFVDDTSSTWTAEEIEAVKATHISISDTISQHASAYNINIHLQFEYHQVAIDMDLNPNDDDAWTEAALSQAGLTSIAEAGRSLEKNRGIKEAPVFMYRNTSGRSFAMTDFYGNDSEYAIIFNDDVDGFIFCHELYHLFGAVDYYYPTEVEQLAETYYPDSIMLNQNEDSTTDPLTAYLIGWTDILSDDALLFLQESSHLTEEYVDAENEKDSYTGQVHDYRIGDGIYTGHLLVGIQHGQGKMVWDDGTCYDGEWDNGFLHGEGTITWADGDSYTGSWQQDYMHGHGTYTWANGNIYTGSWQQGYMHGLGTYTWTSGDSYTGEYQNGLEHGYGVLTWSDGSVYKGSFAEGLFHGYGTYTWPEGDFYTGSWQQGYMHGFGTYTYPDGGVFSGYWENGEYIDQ